MAGYKYKGTHTGPDIFDHIAQTTHPDCGTYKGYMRHRRKNERPCAECKEARKTYRNQTEPKPARPLAPCGTVAAYWRHHRNHQAPCTECKTAHNEYQNQKRGGRKGQPEIAACGTRSGYERHRNLNEDACADCRQANATRKAEWKRKTQAA